MQEMNVRKMTIHDLPQISKINSAVQAFPWSKDALKGELENPLSQGWVTLRTQRNSEIITGYILVRSSAQDGETTTAEVMTLGVALEFQRMGYGQKLLRDGLAFLPRGSTVFLEVSHLNEGALTLYKKMGFELFNTRKGYYPDGSDALCFKLKIAKP